MKRNLWAGLAGAALAWNLGCDRLPIPPKTLARAAACGADPSGTWMLVSGVDVLGPRVLVLQVNGDSSPMVSEQPSFSSRGDWGVGLAGLSSRVECGNIQLTGWVSGTDIEVHMDFALLKDTARGTINGPSGPSPLFGLRVDPTLLLHPDSSLEQQDSEDTTPVILLRFDDSRAPDSTYLRKLISRGLVGELAVPTSLVAGPGFDTWSDIAALVKAGFGVAAHSRIHSAATGPGLPFMVEVIGALTDLKDRGFPTDVFVQPGYWQDSLNFDGLGKLDNWRGALLRNVTRVFEGYEGNGLDPTGRIGHLPLGVGHTTESGPVDSAFVSRTYKDMFVPRTFTVFLFHTADVIPASKLDWLLDSIAVAQREGRVRLVNRSSALLARGETQQ